MKSAPLLVAFTASAALAGGALLAAEDRTLFEPHHAVALLDVADQVGAAWAPEVALAARRVFNGSDLHQGKRAEVPVRRAASLGASGRP